MGSFLDFETVFIPFLIQKNIGKKSKILKIGSLEAEITDFAKIRHFHQNRLILLIFDYKFHNKRASCHQNFLKCIKNSKGNGNRLKPNINSYLKPQIVHKKIYVPVVAVFSPLWIAHLILNSKHIALNQPSFTCI